MSAPTWLLQLLATLAVLLLAQPVAAAPRKEIPSYIHVCKRNDPHLDDCALNSLEKLRPKLVTGIPELNVPSIDPLIIPELVIKPSPNFQAVGKDVKVFGGSDFKVTRLKIDFNETALGFIADVIFPRLNFISDYQVDGRILTLPIKGKGLLTANATDIVGSVSLLGVITKRKGAEYLRFQEAETKLKVMAPVKIHLENLFNGDKTLGDATNAALNENNKELRDVVVPVGERVVSQFALDAANKIAMGYPLDQLLPRE